MKRTLRAQLSVGFAFIILVTVALISLVSTLLINREFENYVERQQLAFSAQIAEGIAMQYDAAEGWNVDYIHGMGMYALNDGYIVKVYDASGETVWDAEDHDMELCHQIMQEIADRMASAGRTGSFTVRSYELVSGEESVGRVDVSYYSSYFYTENDFDFIRSLNVILLVIGVLALVAAVCVGILFARKIARPLARVTEIADEIAQGNYGARVGRSERTKELEELSLSIDNMAEQIEKQEKLRKQLTSDVAHELRTPLANLLAQLEVISEGIFQPDAERMQGIYEEVQRLSLLVDDLSKLQHIENNVLDCTREDLFELCRGVKENFAAEMKKRGIECALTGGQTWAVVDKNKIRQVVTNLLSNAVNYSHEGGKVEIFVGTEADTAVISVRDEGIGIPEQERELIFERFYRTDKSRNRKTGGVGIGLTIVNAIVKAHGGSVSLDSEEGVGSTFTVRLPLSGRE